MTKHFPGGGPQARRRGPALPVRQGSGLSRRQLRVPPAAVRGGLRGRHRAGHAVLRPCRSARELEEVGFGFNRGRDHRPAARPLRLRRRRLHRLGARHRRPLPDGVGLVEAKAWGVEELDAAGARCRRSSTPAATSSAARSCPELLVAARRSGRHLRGAHRRVGAAAPARQVPARALRRPVRRPGGRRADLRSAPSSAAAGERGPAPRDRAARRTTAAAAARAGGARLRRRARSPRSPRPTARSSSDPADADVAIVRRHAPFEPRDGTSSSAFFHAGSLEFPAPSSERDPRARAARCRRSSSCILDRPAVIPELADALRARRSADFGASRRRRSSTSSSAGSRRPAGCRSSFRRRWTRCGRSCRTCRATRTSPLFPFGHGLTYAPQPTT